jgi:3'-phosphoadenosine 5'-phosphosulfate sulfotransferase (PAPS reductase)/FAD synthetase
MLANLSSVIVPAEVQSLIDRGALFVCNHSAGKDSQAMFLLLRDIVPAEQLVVIHAHLPDVEWSGSVEHIRATIGDTPLYVVQAQKTFLDMVRNRGMFPSPKYRQCTSDLKRGPIEKEVRRLSKLTGRNIIVNCMGLRAEESANRSKKTTFKFNAGNSKAGREWYDWLPIHSLKTWQVFATIEEAGQKPHWVYEQGMSRKSCCFCIMSNQADLRTAARFNPSLYETYVQLERSTGQSMLMPIGGVPQFLENVVGIPVAIAA